jgi:hypothetical protein
VDAGTAARLITILLAPTAVAGAVLWAPRVVRAAYAALAGDRAPAPAGPPLERTAADLRRLLAEHEQVRRADGLAVRAARLRALEGALTDCAVEAARALELEVPARSDRAALPREQLRVLLERLAASGVVLPGHERFGR